MHAGPCWATGVLYRLHTLVKIMKKKKPNIIEI